MNHFSACTMMRRRTVSGRVLLLLTALVLLVALGVERAEFVHDYTEMESSPVTVITGDIAHGDAQDNEPSIPSFPATAPAARVAGYSPVLTLPSAPAVFEPDLRPPIAA